jgi:uncharacterized integral membrane protein
VTATHHIPGPPDIQDQPDPISPAPGRRAPDRRSRLGQWWFGLIGSAVVLLFLLIFVLQNGQTARISFLGFHGHLPLGVALLLAAILGVLVVALPGTGRIVQLRLARRRAASRDLTTAAPVKLD